jgi:16S rRNA processing protein RimM
LLRVTSARGQGEFVVATAQELTDRNAAEALKGARILVSRASFPTPDSDEFYWVDLIGCQVFDRQARALGTVDHLIETGPHCVLAIRPEAVDGAEVLIPFVAAYVDRVDTDARRIDVDWSDDFA